jgi:glutathionylspermidine synthase
MKIKDDATQALQLKWLKSSHDSIATRLQHVVTEDAPQP